MIKLISEMSLTEEQVTQAVKEYVYRNTGCEVASATLYTNSGSVSAIVTLTHEPQPDTKGTLVYRDGIDPLTGDTPASLETCRRVVIERMQALRDFHILHENYSRAEAVRKVNIFAREVTNTSIVQEMTGDQCDKLTGEICNYIAANLTQIVKEKK